MVQNLQTTSLEEQIYGKGYYSDITYQSSHKIVELFTVTDTLVYLLENVGPRSNCFALTGTLLDTITFRGKEEVGGQ